MSQNIAYRFIERPYPTDTPIFDWAEDRHLLVWNLLDEIALRPMGYSIKYKC